MSIQYSFLHAGNSINTPRYSLSMENHKDGLPWYVVKYMLEDFHHFHPRLKCTLESVLQNFKRRQYSFTVS